MRRGYAKNTGAFIAALLVVLIAPAAHAQADLITSFFVDNYHFSPNGDGVLDSTTAQYDLADSALVYVLVLADDSTTVIDSLVGGVVQDESQRHAAPWNGRDAGGAPVADGTYLIYVEAHGAAGTDAAYVRVFLDVTRPNATVTNVFPSLFAPDSPDSNLPDTVKFDYRVDDAPPSDSVFVRVTLHEPDGSQVGAPLLDRLVAAGSVRQSVWDGAKAVDGIYEFRVAATDQAGNAHQALATVNVDNAAPTVRSTNLQSNNNVNVPPDTLFGWAYDRNGLQSLEVKLSAGGALEPITNTTIKDDTTFFWVLLSDSIQGDGDYEIHVRAEDVVSRRAEPIYTIRVRTTPPNPPTITSQSGTVRTSKYIVTGRGAGADGSVNIYRNGSVVNGAIAKSDGEFQTDVLLQPGENVITATVVNTAFDLESAPSNAVTVVFDVTPGITIGQPLRPDEPIIVVIGEEARRVQVLIYDLGGDMVRKLEQTQQATNYVFRWDGYNGDNVEVKRGPFVAVVRVDFVSGKSQVSRKPFLFDP